MNPNDLDLLLPNWMRNSISETCSLILVLVDDG